jgi:hypothetical protein
MSADKIGAQHRARKAVLYVRQHRGLNTQLSRHLRQWSTTRCQQ